MANNDDLLPVDPPILVGGGGSSLVWIRKDQAPEPVDHNNYPNCKKPKNPDNYYCYRVKDGHLQVTVNNGTDPNTTTAVKNNKKHHTYFE